MRNKIVLGSIRRRCVAAALDYLLILLAAIGVAAIFMFPFMYALDSSIKGLVLLISLLVFASLGVLLILVSPLVLLTLCEYRYQKTLGKKIMGLRVIPVEKPSMTLVEAFIRNLIKNYLSILCFLGLFTNKQKQLLHDMVVHTIVVQEARGK